MNSTTITESVARKFISLCEPGLSKGLGNPKPGEMCVEAALCQALGLPHGDDPGCVWQSLRRLKIRLNDANWSSNKARAKGLMRLGLAQIGSAGFAGERKFILRVAELAIRKSVPEALRAAASMHKDTKHKAAMLDAAAKCEREGTRQSALEAKSTAAYAAAADADAYADAAAYAAADAAYTAAYAAADADAYADAAADAYADAAAAAYADAAAAAYADAAAAADAAAYTAADAAAYTAAYADAAAARDKSLASFAEAVVQILIEMKAPGCQWLTLTEAP